MDKTQITIDDAAATYGIRTNHEMMPNGERRFRLTSDDGNDYIRTVAGTGGAWQKAHYHTALRETYVVETGWMALAEEVDGKAVIRVYWPSDVVTTKPSVVHNVYLPAASVIHTVKHGSREKGDWTESAAFTELTTAISEREIHAQNSGGGTRQTADPRFDAYVFLYNSLDDLIWRIPGYLATGAAVLIGFAGSVLSKDKLPDFPPVLLASLFFFVGLLFFLSGYSLTRIRRHHTWAGDELARMESDGYFHRRREFVQRKWPPAAPIVFRWTYVALWIVFWALAALSVLKYGWLVALMSWRPS